MPLLRECDICGKVDRDFVHAQPICGECVRRNEEMKQEAFKETRKDFEAHVAAQVSILDILRHVKDTQIGKLHAIIGTLGMELLDKALADVDTAMKT